VLNSWAIRVQQFKSLAKRRVTQSVLQVVVQLLTPFFARGPIGLLAGDCAGRAGGSLTLLADTVRYARRKQLRLLPRKIIQGAKRYKRFPVYGMGSVLLHTALTALPPLLLARFFGLQTAGWFGLVNQVLGVAVGLVGLGVAQVYLSNAAQLAHTSPGRLRSLFLKTSRAAFLIAALPLTIILLMGRPIFAVIFGANWGEAGIYGQILALPFLIMLTVGPVFPTLTVLERQDWQFVADAAGVLIMVFGIRYVHDSGRSGRWAVGVYGIAISITYLLLFALAYFAISHHDAKSGLRASEGTPLE
jgi:O-antigen/teichoic acid export membrane protein